MKTGIQTKKTRTLRCGSENYLKFNKSFMFCQVFDFIKKIISSFKLQFPCKRSSCRKYHHRFIKLFQYVIKIGKIAVAGKQDPCIELPRIQKYVRCHFHIKIGFFQSFSSFIKNYFYRFCNNFESNFLQFMQKIIHSFVIFPKPNIITIFQHFVLFLEKMLYFDPIQPKTGFLLSKIRIGSINKYNCFLLGHKFNITQKNRNCQIDDPIERLRVYEAGVRIYNYALTSLQVGQLYNQGSSIRFGPSSGSP
ncbi:MAG: hypothetical protein UY44_C0020G0013 [Candidatus Kaiserbacteria bacterium GW2011_GWA2_49_19]|uniref:Uncharacterized protein n=1 Tax=Candidatus Kaiserbacteria bacterium GW2011_GWA2_49_19 TaxID=1618669 RepID=A0A0G1XZB6_9BACT|nr:MAG: hypothetical protein UY44_C0020G0013 [Candidatus Kaiserbacteria bacterium GW2011_GWA2_49_19]